MHIPKSSDVAKSYERIKPFIHHTPVFKSTDLNNKVGTNVWLKCENFQKVGAFKFRGACNAVLPLESKLANNGVATHSSGNHGQAIAKAAQIKGIPAYIVMPENAPRIKIEAVKNYGAEIVFCEPTQLAREKTLEKVIQQTKAYFVHPYNDPNVVLGQSSAAWEFLHEIPELELIITPVGGGGLLSGSILAAEAFHALNNLPLCKVMAAEPEQANDAYRSMQSGSIQSLTDKQIMSPTIADGLRTTIGNIPFHIIRRTHTEIICVSEESIVKAMRYIWERFNMIIEASCAVPIAALLENKITPTFKNIGVIITGGNVDLDHLPWNKRQ